MLFCQLMSVWDIWRELVVDVFMTTHLSIFAFCNLLCTTLGHFYFPTLQPCPTEVFEDDMFVCGYKYNESDKEIKRARPFKVVIDGDCMCV